MDDAFTMPNLNYANGRKVKWMVSQNLTPECDRCGNRLPILPGDDAPAMLGFKHKSGTIINLCRNCIIEFGKNKGEMETFLNDLGLSEDKKHE